MITTKKEQALNTERAKEKLAEAITDNYQAKKHKPYPRALALLHQTILESCLNEYMMTGEITSTLIDTTVFIPIIDRLIEEIFELKSVIKRVSKATGEHREAILSANCD